MREQSFEDATIAARTDMEMANKALSVAWDKAHFTQIELETALAKLEACRQAVNVAQKAYDKKAKQWSDEHGLSK